MTGLNLSESQQLAFDAVICEKKSCFITGGAGTGKSYVVKCIKERLKEEKRRFHILAPTGVAAENIEGQTYHSLFGIYPNKIHYTDFRVVHVKTKGKLRKVEVLIFDEISMISGQTLDLLNLIAQDAKGNNSSFGGIQVVFVGDFCQLLPIGYDREDDIKCPNIRKERGLAFQSRIWRQLIPSKESMYTLKESYRQTDDSDFLDILNKIRFADDYNEEEKLQICDALNLNDHSENSGRVGSTWLYPRNLEKDRTNNDQLKALSHDHIVTYRPHSWREKGIDPYNIPKDSDIRKQVELKIGCEVMLTRNLRLREPYLVNGSRGKIINFQSTHDAIKEIDTLLRQEEKLEHEEDSDSRYIDHLHFQREYLESESNGIDLMSKMWPVIQFYNGGEAICVVPVKWHCSNDLSEEQTVVYAYLPLTLAWALTINKAQGLTIESSLAIDFSHTFDDHQVYTALTRVRRKECLQIKGLKVEKLKSNPLTRSFYRNEPTRKWKFHRHFDDLYQYIRQPSDSSTACEVCGRCSKVCEMWHNNNNSLRCFIEDKTQGKFQDAQRRSDIISIFKEAGLQLEDLYTMLQKADSDENVASDVLIKDIPEIKKFEAKKLFACIKPMMPQEKSQQSPQAHCRPTKQRRLSSPISSASTPLHDLHQIDEWGPREEERVYVIKMGYFYYVGKSKNPRKRLEQHQKGEGAEFTRHHKEEHMTLEMPFTTIDGSVAAWERSETLHRMNEHGIDYVRGSTFTEITLDQRQKDEIQKLIDDEFSACYTCHRQGHVQRDCPRCIRS